MAERDASPTPAGLRASRTDKQPDDTTILRSSVTNDDHPESRLPQSDRTNDTEKRRSKGAIRSHHKNRSSGAFLLPNALPGEAALPDRAHSQRRRRHAAVHITKSGSNTPERSSNGTSSGGQTLTPEPASRRSAQTRDTLSGTTMAKRDSIMDSILPDAAHRSSMAPLDMDSAQIVNMALNLSESRRQAARRNVSSPLPPRLSPLPDSAAGGSLRQHLQQQRRASRNISPKPGAIARTATAQSQRVASPLQASFEHEGSYRYHFSQSTLSRAQKAKDYLELLAQYRRVLDLVPPLNPDQSRRLSTVSPPGSPTSSSHPLSRTSVDISKLGRPYNPLQYIRNRKVRARERKTIDGETQGFINVSRVTEWVDEAAKNVASGQLTPGGSTLPQFNTPEEAANDAEAAGLRPVVTISKPKRPRVDWVMDPADMLADVYWLEQGSNKKLVEDRHWRRVFPQDSALYRPLSRQPDDATAPVPAMQVLSNDPAGLRVETDPAGIELKQAKGEHEHVLGSARERAQQKLQALKGLHHRHSSYAHQSPHHHRDLLHSRHGSVSESSENDSDRKQRSRQGTIESVSKDILEKQMMEILAREQREKELDSQREAETRRRRSLTIDSLASEGDSVIRSSIPSRALSHRRQQSVADVSEADGKVEKPQKAHPASPIYLGRNSLEVPTTGRRLSIDHDTSHPGSPELRPVRTTGLIPAIGMDLSPGPSRPTSPSRNPISKVKSIFRDRSRERNADRHSDERGTSLDTALSAVEVASSPAPAPADGVTRQSFERKGSRSPVRKVISRGSETSNKSPLNHGSIRLRGNDSSSGLRGLLKAPRIDSVLRSGVSKVSDMIWRKDSEPTGGDSPSTSSDESDTEPSRGRTRDLAIHADHQEQKSYLNVMPHFVPTSESYGKQHPGEQGLLYPANSGSRPLSRRSSRFELLKPPKIDVHDPSPKSSPPARATRYRNGSDTSGSRKSSHTDGVRAADARLNAVISMPKPQHLAAGPAPAQRHWSISDGRTAEVHASVSKAEIARLRTLVLSSGIMAMEIDRRAKERCRPGESTNRLLLPGGKDRPSTPTASKLEHASSSSSPSALLAPITTPAWTSIASMHPDPQTRKLLSSHPLSQTELFPTAARTLAAAIEQAGTAWQVSADGFANETAPQLRRRVEAARGTVAGRLSDLTRAAADEADEVGLDLSQGQRLKVKRVVDTIEKMLRRRRRRFRWVRRGLWLGVEWVLVGFMWYVWFVVMIARMFLGVGKGIVTGVRWLLWL